MVKKVIDKFNEHYIFGVFVFKTHLILIRYCARATDSALPVIVMVRSILLPDSRSSQFEIRIMAPLSCLKQNERRIIFNLDMKNVSESLT